MVSSPRVKIKVAYRLFMVMPFFLIGPSLAMFKLVIIFEARVLPHFLEEIFIIVAFIHIVILSDGIFC